MSLVATRQKLQPFVSEGVVYKDRKKRILRDEPNPVYAGKHLEFRVETKVAYLKKEIRKFMKSKSMKELEQIYKQITIYDRENLESERIYNLMRLDII